MFAPFLFFVLVEVGQVGLFVQKLITCNSTFFTYISNSW